MRIAVLSDLHANADALEAVLAHAETQRVDAYWCLGDIVGYGAEPDRVVERTRSLVSSAVAGNHDYAACGKLRLRSFNRYAAAAAEWTRRIMKRDNLAWLGGLPLSTRQDGALLVHATPSEPEAWHYCLSLEDAEEELRSFEDRLCLIGHSHFPGTFESAGGSLRYTRTEEVRLAEGGRYLVNVGSVGQPRDGDPRAAYLLYDHGEGRIRHMRVTYDVAAAARKIVEAGLPRFLAERLALGE